MPEFSRRLLALTELAPAEPPFLVSSGLQLADALRRRLGDRECKDGSSDWEQLLSLRQGPGADGFVLWPLPSSGDGNQEPLLERAVEICALVASVREHRARHDGQPLDRVLRKEALRIRRVPLRGEDVPVMVRLGSSYVVVQVADQHPRQLRDEIVAAFESAPRGLGHLRLRRVAAPLAVSLLPVPLAQAVHLHRWGVEGPWLSWSQAGHAGQVGVLAAHHLVLEGPGFACLRTDFRRRVRAMRLALGLDATESEWDGREGFGPWDAMPFRINGFSGDEELEELLSDAPGGGSIGTGPLYSHGSHRLHDQGIQSVHESFPESLARLAQDEHWSWLHPGRWTGRGLTAPSLRYATIERGSFSLSTTCYAFCCAQHRVMQELDQHYSSQGFTFVVPLIAGDDAFSGSARRRARPVLCALHTRGGLPEPYESFRRRLDRRLEEAERDDDLLSQVLTDVFRIALPDAIKSAAVRLFERAPRDGGTFLGGRGLVAYARVPDDAVDPVANFAGIYEGLFGGSCQERGGVALSIIDRGYRRDLCAVGTGVFRREAAMDSFWRLFAEQFSEQGM